jgi:Arc/MetJ-type ribon-helix-helix transcriptional regulator
MAIPLKPELEELVREDVQRGPYASVEEYLEQAVTMLHRQEVWLAAHRDEIGDKIEEGWASAQRGEVFTPEQVQEEMRAKKQAWIEKQRTA